MKKTLRTALMLIALLATPTLSAQTKGPETITVKGVSFTMIPVEGGTFTMGETANSASDNAKPAHSVTLSDYMIGQTEVTQDLWYAVMGKNPANFQHHYYPVESVSWEECQEFIAKLNTLTGRKFRLPTEAEWEYAARGGNKSHGYKYSGSHLLDEVAWYDGNGEYRIHAVQQKKPNELDLYDMTGNVNEWCQDWYRTYEAGAKTNPQGPASGITRVYRGGTACSYEPHCRVTSRQSERPVSADSLTGLRLCL